MNDPNKITVEQFIQSIEDPHKKQDCLTLVNLIQKITHIVPHMWGSSIIGFGTYHYTYESGREGDTIIIGFSPRKQAIVVYGVIFYEFNRKELQKLGKFTTGKGCLYIKKLEDIDLTVLTKMISTAYEYKTSNKNFEDYRL